jgi:ferredoxin-thioredoxin reductase catalytic subunit
MVKLFREQAIRILSGIDLLIDYDSSARESILVSLYSEDDEYENISDYADPKYNDEITELIITSYIGVKNDYLTSKIHDVLHIDILITDDEDYSLSTCPCCKYKTITERGDYEICPVCDWEDDGSEDLKSYSHVNHMTLEEAKTIFSEKDESFEKQYHKA